VEELSEDLRHFAVQKLQAALEAVGWPEPLTTQQELADKVPIQAFSRADGVAEGVDKGGCFALIL
jgi:hypothetical protein